MAMEIYICVHVHAKQYQIWFNVFVLSVEDRLMQCRGFERIAQ